MSKAILESLLVISFLLSVGLFFWAIFNQIYVTHLCFMHLRRFHPAEYERLGEPHMFLNNTIAGGLAFLDFVSSGRFRQLSDHELERLIRRRTILGRLALAGAISFLACLVAMSILSASGST